MQLFSRTLTVIVNGEITQLFSSRCHIDRQEYYQRIYAKTASLFETSAYSPALLANSDPSVRDIFKRYGHQIGMAFQIMDDIFDFTSQEEKLGKPVGSDLRQGLITLPTIYYAENHPENPDVRYLQDGNCLESTSQAVRLIEAIRNSQAIEQSRNEARQFVSSALEALNELPDYPQKELLSELAVYIVERDL
jgi:geranylgeranyl pyrophosphate synthase